MTDHGEVSRCSSVQWVIVF